MFRLTKTYRICREAKESKVSDAERLPPRYQNELGGNRIFTDQQATSNLLSSARKEMYDALRLFQDHVKHLLSLMFTVMAAVFAVLGLIIKEEAPELINPTIISVLGGLVLILLFPLGLFSTIIISRYYRLYVCALTYAADLHESVGQGNHPWFKEAIKKRDDLFKEAIKERDNLEPPDPDLFLGKFIDKRTYGWPHSWRLYAILIGLVASTSLVVGILILFNPTFIIPDS